MDRNHPSSREGVKVFSSDEDINNHLGSRLHRDMGKQEDLELD
jgi:hypothetical protein